MRIALSLCLWLLSLSVHAQVTAELNRNPITEQETVTLTLSINQQVNGISPDVTPLQQDFDVVSQSQSSQVQIFNNDQFVLTQWLITLFPKRSGDLVIPPIQVGKDTSQALVLTVKAVDKQQADGSEAEVFLQLETDADSIYVQAQLLVTLKLFTRVNLQRYELSELQLPGVSINKLGDDKVSEVLRNNQRYTMLERRYAVFPESSGKLDIPALQFTAAISEQQRRSLFEFNPGQGRIVRVRSEPASVEVKAKPADFPGAWLAAKAVTLRETWQPDPPQFTVGEPVTRTLSFSAVGVDNSLLPELSLPTLDAIKQYPDQPQINTQSSANGLIAQREEKFALVPNRAGSFTLPEIRVPWWDTTSQQVQYAVIPARTVQVLPSSTAPPVPSMPPVATDSSATTPLVAPQVISVTDSTWQWISAGLGAGWLFTVLLWWLKRRPAAPLQTQPEASPRLAESRRAIKHACHNNDPHAAKDALLAWAKVRWPGSLINSVSKLAGQLDDVNAQAALRQFDAYLYAPQGGDWNGQAFWQLLGKVLDTEAHARPAAPPDLPRLYPQTLHS